jgi:hypothetical protein
MDEGGPCPLPGEEKSNFRLAAYCAKRSLADSFTIVSVASIRIVLGSAQHIRKLHLLAQNRNCDLEGFRQNPRRNRAIYGNPSRLASI